MFLAETHYMQSARSETTAGAERYCRFTCMPRHVAVNPDLAPQFTAVQVQSITRHYWQISREILPKRKDTLHWRAWNPGCMRG
jgi:hypothetical protein